MKQALIVLALVGLAFSAPQPRKPFHEHFDDFMNVIFAEAGDDLDQLLEHYMEFDDFLVSYNYMRTNNFKELVYEMESLPEFKAVVDFLEEDNIDIHFFLDMFNDLLENGFEPSTARKSRLSVSGTDLSAFIADCISAFPKAQLSALYDEKMANDEEFNSAMTNLQSDEWNQVLSALLDSDKFHQEADAFLSNGIDLHSVFDEVIAIFGQN